ncbi:MAG: hypothetical protein WCT20_05450 [Candidatus Babeliales bacterium]|jgi:hypothetical protein
MFENVKNIPATLLSKAWEIYNSEEATGARGDGRIMTIPIALAGLWFALDYFIK